MGVKAGTEAVPHRRRVSMRLVALLKRREVTKSTIFLVLGGLSRDSKEDSVEREENFFVTLTHHFSTRGTRVLEGSTHLSLNKVQANSSALQISRNSPSVVSA